MSQALQAWEAEDEIGEAIYGEDALAWILGQGRDPAATGPAEILEVSQICGDSVTEMRYFPPGQSVRVGSGTKLCLQLAGISLGEVPSPVRALSYLAPGVASVEEVWRHPFQVPSDLLPAPDHPLLQAQGQQWVARISPSWGGFLEVDGIRRGLESLNLRKDPDGLYSIPIPEEGLLALDLGGPIFVIRKVARSRALKLEPMEGDHSMVAMAAFFSFLVAMLGSSIAMAPAPRTSTQEDGELIATMILQRPKEEPAAPAVKGPEGKVGKTDATQPKTKGKLSKAANDQKTASEAGILGALNDHSDLSEGLASSGLSSGIRDGIGGLIGPKGTQVGSGGLGSREGGLGGGGTADRLGGLGTDPHGKGISDGHFTDRGHGNDITLPSETVVLGSLDKALIDAVIKRNLQAIRYCYQRELGRTPGLAGKVKVRFVIAGDGSVSTASTASSSLNNSSVESCINGRFMRMAFPQPKGGGIVVVSYPFLFSAQ